MRAASTSSSGTVRKNCRNRKVAVADAISGTVRPGVAVEHAQVRNDLVGGPDAHFHRQHQRDKDRPEEEHAKREPEIDDREGRQQGDGNLANGNDQRLTRLTIIMRPTGPWRRNRPCRCRSRRRCSSRSGGCPAAWAWVSARWLGRLGRRHEGQVQGKGHDQHAQMSTTWENTLSRGRRSIMAQDDPGQRAGSL
jgi:hypothetical protein